MSRMFPLDPDLGIFDELDLKLRKLFEQFEFQIRHSKSVKDTPLILFVFMSGEEEKDLGDNVISESIVFQVTLDLKVIDEVERRKAEYSASKKIRSITDEHFNIGSFAMEQPVNDVTVETVPREEEGQYSKLHFILTIEV